MTGSKSKKQKIFVAAALILLFIAALYIASYYIPELSELFGIDDTTPVSSAGQLQVHYIDVGQGDSELIICPDGTAMLIDAGPNSAEDELIAYLDSQNITSFKYVVFTHPHEDHIGGGDKVMNRYKVENVIMPDVINTSSSYERLLRAIENNGCGVIIAEPGEVYMLGGSKENEEKAFFKILAPIEINAENLNNCSVVLRLTYNKTAFLFTGDAEKESELLMLNRFSEEELRADVLKVGHHGSYSSTSYAFVTAVSPVCAVISCGEYNDYGHPHREPLQILNEFGVTIYRTDLFDTVVFLSDGNSVSMYN